MLPARAPPRTFLLLQLTGAARNQAAILGTVRTLAFVGQILLNIQPYRMLVGLYGENRFVESYLGVRSAFLLCLILLIPSLFDH